MNVQSLTLTNFRSFEKLELDFNDPSFYEKISNDPSARRDFFAALKVGIDALLKAGTADSKQTYHPITVPKDLVSCDSERGEVSMVAKAQGYDIMLDGTASDVMRNEFLEVCIDVRLEQDSPDSSFVFDWPGKPKHYQSMRMAKLPEVIHFGDSSLSLSLLKFLAS